MPEVARFEPKLALDGGLDGLAAYRCIATAVPALLAPSGHLLIEVGLRQVPEISKIFGSAGLAAPIPWKDLGGLDRVISLTH